MGLLSPTEKPQPDTPKAGLLAQTPAAEKATGLLSNVKPLLDGVSPYGIFNTDHPTAPFPVSLGQTQTSTPAIAAPGTPNITPLSFAASVAQGTARGYGALGAFLAAGPAGTINQPVPAFTPEPGNTALGKIEQTVFGTDKPFSLQTVGEEYPFVKPGSKLAQPLAIGGVLLDLVGGEGLKGAEGLSKVIAASKDTGEISTLLRNAGFEEDIIKHAAPKLADMTDAQAVKDGLLHLETLQNSTKAAPSTPALLDQAAPDAVASRPIAPTLPEKIPGTAIPETATHLPSSPSYTQTLPDVSQFDEAASVGIQSAKDPSIYQRVATSLKNGLTTTLEYVQNSEQRVKDLVESKAYKVTDQSDPYLRMTLYPGRVATQVEEGYIAARDIVTDLTKLAKDNGTDLPGLRGQLHDLLVARHAPERNAALSDGAAGITTKTAGETLSRINSAPYGKQLGKIADKAAELNRKSLSLLKDSGVISEELFTRLGEKYKNHVPLQRIFDDSADVGSILSGKGFDVKGTGIRRAVGSDRAVADVFTNIVANYEQAVLRAEKNVVDQATLAFVRTNEKELRGLIELQKPSVIGKASDGRPIFEHTSDPSILQMYDNGKPVWIKINDPRLAIALRGVNKEKLPTLLRAVGAVTRLYAGLATRFNPEFAFPNKIRDLQEVAVYLAAQKEVGLKGAARMTLRDPASVKDVISAIRGTDTEGARLYNELKEMGGTTGGFGLSTRKQVELNIENLEKLARSKPRKFAQGTLGLIDHWNTVFEDSTRLSVYKQGLASGLSKERAAAMAKEASINFNRMGTGGPVVNALWMFSNASIQGSVKMIRSMKDPKVAAGLTAIIGGSVAAVSDWNDHVDPDWRNKVSAWDRLNGLAVVLPNKDGDGVSYLTIPVSWGIKPIMVMANYAVDAFSDQKFDPKKMVSDVFTSILNAYNPVGGTDITSAVTPTVLDVPVEIARNQQWSGSKIRPDSDPNAPADTQYFSSLKDTKTGQAAIATTNALQKYTGIALSPADLNYAFGQYVGGAGRTIEKVGNTLVGAATNNLPPADEFPFLSRFYRMRTQEEVGAGAPGDSQQVKDILQNQSRDRFNLKQQAEDTYATLKGLPQDQAKHQFEQLLQDNPDLAAKVSDIGADDKKGLTYTDRLVKQLGVEDGERAKFITGKLLEKDTNIEKGKLWQEYVDKGLITPDVANQITTLLQDQKAQTPPEGKKTSALTKLRSVTAMLSPVPTLAQIEKDQGVTEDQARTIQKKDAQDAGVVRVGDNSYIDPTGAVGAIDKVAGRVAAKASKELLASAADTMKEELLHAFSQPHTRPMEKINMKAEAEAADFVQFLKEMKKPTLEEMSKGMELLRLTGRDTKGIADRVINTAQDHLTQVRDTLGRFTTKFE